MTINALANQFTIDREGNYKLLRQVTVLLDPPVVIHNSSAVLMDKCTLCLEDGNRLILAKGYTWNGASGATIDTPDTYRASCVHDALYAMIHVSEAGRQARLAADRNFLRMLKEDGMPWIRRWTWYLFVRLFGWRYC